MKRSNDVTGWVMKLSPYFLGSQRTGSIMTQRIIGCPARGLHVANDKDALLLAQISLNRRDEDISYVFARLQFGRVSIASVYHISVNKA